MPRYADRSLEACEYRRLYNRAAWAKLRDAQLLRQPLCEYCLDRGKVTEAKVVNHRIPHRGDLDLFHDPDNLESTCAPCHDNTVRQVELWGYHNRVSETGWPVDRRHPANADNRLPVRVITLSGSLRIEGYAGTVEIEATSRV